MIKGVCVHSIKSLIATDYAIPRSEVRLLLQHLLSKSLSQLIMDDNYFLSDIEYCQFTNMILQRQNNMPIAYIVGYKEFYSREFIVNENTLIPRPETELIIDIALSIAMVGDKILDVGTGSGCIATTLKLESPDLYVEALDNYSETLQVAMQNATKLGANVKFIRSNWFSNITGNYNIIISNPPYIANNDPHLGALFAEPLYALSDFNDGLNCIRVIVEAGKKYLLKGGYMIIEHGYDQGELVRNIFVSNGFRGVVTFQDYGGLDRVTRAQFL